MDIRDVSAIVGRSDQSGRSASARSGSSSAKSTEELAAQDIFENSGRLGQVRALIDSLIQVPSVRETAVSRGKQLLASGELDSPEAAQKAAEGFLEASEGLVG